MKIDRLLGIVMYLLNRNVVSAQAPAEKFEVPQRTIQRDIDAIRMNGTMILNKVLENIQQLQCELQKISSSIQNEIVSVIIDGSIIRGDFIEDSSNIDITITTLHKNVDLQIKKHIEEAVKNIQSKLPKREQPRKPLIYDVQWQVRDNLSWTHYRLLIVQLGFDNTLDLHCSYARDQILVALDFIKPNTVREGVKYLPDKGIDIFFITLNKSDDDAVYQYILKKEAEGKAKKVAKIAALNKF